MTIEPLVQFGALVVAAYCTAYLSLWVLARMVANPPPSVFFEPENETAAFLFDDDQLIDTTAHGTQFLQDIAPGKSVRQALLEKLSTRFPKLREKMDGLAEQERFELVSSDNTQRLVAEWKNGLARIALYDDTEQQTQTRIDLASLHAMQREIETLRATAQSAPFLVWRQAENGAITWANNAYLELSQKGKPPEHAATWPPVALFDMSDPGPDEPGQSSRRVTLHLPGEATCRWYECFETRVGDERLFMAVSADEVVKAEVALRDFVQTLSKTFAHLKTGLAIFDKQRRLKLFNPALTDLTALPVDFLSGRPTLLAFLDRLREKKMLPEPKDYKSWRQQFQELEDAAKSGTYEETWTLSTGQTYRVVGRPHPDGAVAFLIDDISGEISLTRRFRAAIETSQAVMDSLDESVAVFSPSGIMILSNTSYANLWGIDPSRSVGKQGIQEASQHWSNSCAPSPVWGDAREFICAMGERAEWHADVRLLDGRKLNCRFTPIAGGATLVGFRVVQKVGKTGPPEKAGRPPYLLEPKPVSR